MSNSLAAWRVVPARVGLLLAFGITAPACHSEPDNGAWREKQEIRREETIKELIDDGEALEASRSRARAEYRKKYGKDPKPEQEIVYRGSRLTSSHSSVMYRDPPEVEAQKHRQLVERAVSSNRESGHEAGREWALESGITAESDCSSPSPSFEAGCVEAVREMNAGRNAE